MAIPGVPLAIEALLLTALSILYFWWSLLRFPMTVLSLVILSLYPLPLVVASFFLERALAFYLNPILLYLIIITMLPRFFSTSLKTKQLKVTRSVYDIQKKNYKGA
jgi:hypothetical protein